MNIIHKIWYFKNKIPLKKAIIVHLIYYILIPLSLVYYIYIIIRKFLYNSQIIKSYKSDIPIIVVGNIIAGGSGKTPIVISLALALKNRNLNIGIVSRGYKAKIPLPIIINSSHNAKDVGDEPLLIFKKTQLPICVHSNRVLAINTLIEYHKNLDVIISDDGLQHLKMQRNIECVVFNKNELGNGMLIPAGPLRENIRKWDYTLYSNDNISNNIIQKSKSKAIHISRINNNLYTLNNNEIKQIYDLHNKNVLIIAGIAHPDSIKDTLELENLNIKIKIYEKLGDHEIINEKHILDINNNYINYDIIITTEKDIIKYTDDSLWKKLKKPIWVISLEAITPNYFIEELLELIKINH